MEKQDLKKDATEETIEMQDMATEKTEKNDQLDSTHDETVCSAEFPKGCI